MLDFLTRTAEPLPSGLLFLGVTWIESRATETKSKKAEVFRIAPGLLLGRGCRFMTVDGRESVGPQGIEVFA